MHAPRREVSGRGRGVAGGKAGGGKLRKLHVHHLNAVLLRFVVRFVDVEGVRV